MGSRGAGRNHATQRGPGTPRAAGVAPRQCQRGGGVSPGRPRGQSHPTVSKLAEPPCGAGSHKRLVPAESGSDGTLWGAGADLWGLAAAYRRLMELGWLGACSYHVSGAVASRGPAGPVLLRTVARVPTWHPHLYAALVSGTAGPMPSRGHELCPPRCPSVGGGRAWVWGAGEERM